MHNQKGLAFYILHPILINLSLYTHCAHHRLQQQKMSKSSTLYNHSLFFLLQGNTAALCNWFTASVGEDFPRKLSAKAVRSQTLLHKDFHWQQGGTFSNHFSLQLCPSNAASSQFEGSFPLPAPTASLLRNSTSAADFSFR